MLLDIHTGDCLDVMRTLDANSVDSIVTDPPYGLGFMGKAWDHAVPGVEFWTEMLRVAKPGAYLLAFGGSRTFHRMACAIEDAGWEIRDTIMWLYGSGFPKSLDVSKAIDKARRRDYVQAAVDIGVDLPGRSINDWTKEGHAPGDKWWGEFKAALPAETWAAIERRVVGSSVSGASAWFASGVGDITAPATEAASQWQGWGTALKPAHEPIIMARKPLIGTVAANVLAYGTGGLNIDGCRVGETGARNNGRKVDSDIYGKFGPTQKVDYGMGRWPANVIHDGSEEVLAGFPQSSITGARTAKSKAATVDGTAWLTNNHESTEYTDSGSAARFFYCAKADREDRNDGCDALPEMPSLKMDPTSAMARDGRRGSGVASNNHPTVKPTDLMRYLCRLVTPAGGVVLDPFMGSGSTGKAALLEGLRFVGIEQSAEYAAIARARIQPLLLEQMYA